MHALISHVHTMQLIDGAELTHMRTAAASAAAVKVCIMYNTLVVRYEQVVIV